MNDDTRDMRETHPARRGASDGPTPPDPPSMDGRGSEGGDDHVPSEEIAAWLDTPDDFDASERAWIAAHVASCPRCQEIVADLQGVVAALATLPQVPAPRSFSLTREMAGALPAQVNAGERSARREPVQMRQTNAWYERQFRAVRWATAVAAVLFVFVLGVDLVTNRIDPNRASDDAAMSAQSEVTTGGGAAGGAASDEMPPNSGGDDASTDARVAEDAELADEPASTEGAAFAAEEAEQPEDAQGDASATLATDASGSAQQEADGELTGESTDSTLAVKESDTAEQGDADADTYPSTMTADGSQRETVDESSERLRIIQVALALILVWLLAAMIALPRMRRG